MSASLTAIEAIGVSLSIGSRTIFSDLSLSVSAGEVVALVGTNGSGKTSLLNVFSALLRSTKGQALLYGESVSRSGPAAVATRRQGVGRSFQVPFLQDEFSVWMNVRLGSRIARAAGMDASKFLRNAHEMAEALALEPIRKTPVSALSLGQRRRVELARVFATGAGILLLDEPFANLDEKGTDTVGALLSVAASGGAALLIVEHRQDAIVRFCDKSISIHDGRIISVTR